MLLDLLGSAVVKAVERGSLNEREKLA
uniref:Uncharacterized protein n=1 Tax=Anopheles albimanus TaxID=7167 RepID=A0A182FX54_ANOAL